MRGPAIQALSSPLSKWAADLISRFSLDIEPPVVRLEPLPKRLDGLYRTETCHPTTKHKVIINSRRLNRPSWVILQVLFHQLLHQWQEQHGRPGRQNYHNREFRDKAASFGLQISPGGATFADPHGAFYAMLMERAVDTSENAFPVVLDDLKTTKPH